jgi:F-type H+-transporting ATPase subunit delta
MKISKRAKRDAKELLRSCAVNGLLDEGRVRNAIQRVVEVKPRGYVAILSHFERLVKLDIDRRTARVESAVPLTPELQASVKSNLTQVYGPGLDISFGQNPKLIGGMRIKVGSDVYDGSVQARLAALEQSF